MRDQERSPATTAERQEERDDFLRDVIAELFDGNKRWPGLWTRLDSLMRERDTLASALRREWWTNHGHDYHALYGDDGEMACNACPADFKRDPLDRLEKLVVDARLERAAEAFRAEEKP